MLIESDVDAIAGHIEPDPEPEPTADRRLCSWCLVALFLFAPLVMHRAGGVKLW